MTWLRLGQQLADHATRNVAVGVALDIDGHRRARAGTRVPPVSSISRYFACCRLTKISAARLVLRAAVVPIARLVNGVGSPLCEKIAGSSRVSSPLRRARSTQRQRRGIGHCRRPNTSSARPSRSKSLMLVIRIKRRGPAGGARPDADGEKAVKIAEPVEHPAAQLQKLRAAPALPPCFQGPLADPKPPCGFAAVKEPGVDRRGAGAISAASGWRLRGFGLDHARLRKSTPEPR